MCTWNFSNTVCLWLQFKINISYMIGPALLPNPEAVDPSGSPYVQKTTLMSEGI